MYQSPSSGFWDGSGVRWVRDDLGPKPKRMRGKVDGVVWVLVAMRGLRLEMGRNWAYRVKRVAAGRGKGAEKREKVSHKV